MNALLRLLHVAGRDHALINHRDVASVPVIAHQLDVPVHGLPCLRPLLARPCAESEARNGKSRYTTYYPVRRSPAVGLSDRGLGVSAFQFGIWRSSGLTRGLKARFCFFISLNPTWTEASALSHPHCRLGQLSPLSRRVQAELPRRRRAVLRPSLPSCRQEDSHNRLRVRIHLAPASQSGISRSCRKIENSAPVSGFSLTKGTEPLTLMRQSLILRPEYGPGHAGVPVWGRWMSQKGRRAFVAAFAAKFNIVLAWRWRRIGRERRSSTRLGRI